MEERVLKAFITVAEELNFRKAADRLNMTQPPLSRMISGLEMDLGVKLFSRTTRSVELTGAGLHLYSGARDLLEQMLTLEQEVRNLQRHKNGRLNLAIVNGGALHSTLPKLISSFKEQFPNINVVMIKADSNSIMQQLKSSKIDISFGINRLQDASLEQLPVMSQKMGILLKADHKLARKKLIRISDLAHETLIFHGKHDQLGFQEEFLSYLKLRGIRPRVYYKKAKESCAELTAEGAGLLLTTKKSTPPLPDTIFIPFEDYSAKLKIFASWSTKNTTLPLKAFVNFIEEQMNVPVSDLDGHFSN